MSNSPAAGFLVLSVSSARGAICAVEIESGRPQGVGRLLQGRHASEAPRLAGQLFSLCGCAQSFAASLALQAAGHAGDVDPAKATLGITAELVFETLRSATLSWPGFSGRYVGLADAAASLRQALAASQDLVGQSRSDTQPDQARMRAAVEKLKNAAGCLGHVDGSPVPSKGSLLDAICAETAADRSFLSCSVDGLTARDDLDVIAGIERDADGFAANPTLPGRLPETGAHVRWWPLADSSASTLRNRLHSRLCELDAAFLRLDRALEGDGDLSILASYSEQGGTGTGVVECARGRLYHRYQTDGDGRITQAAIVAPTEWNFQPGGPLATALMGATVGRGEKARASVNRLAALFDPCVAFEVVLKEAAHA